MQYDKSAIRKVPHAIPLAAGSAAVSREFPSLGASRPFETHAKAAQRIETRLNVSRDITSRLNASRRVETHPKARMGCGHDSIAL